MQEKRPRAQASSPQQAADPLLPTDAELALEPDPQAASAQPSTWHDATASRPVDAAPFPASADSPAAAEALDQPTAARDATPAAQADNRVPAGLGSIAIIEPMLWLAAVASAAGMLLGLYFLFAGFEDFAEAERTSLQRDLDTLQVQVEQLQTEEQGIEPAAMSTAEPVASQSPQLSPDPQLQHAQGTLLPVAVDPINPATAPAPEDHPPLETEVIESAEPAEVSAPLAAQIDSLRAQLTAQSDRIDQLVDENSRLRTQRPRAAEPSNTGAEASQVASGSAVARNNPAKATEPVVTISEQPAKSTTGTRIDGAQTGVGARSIDDEAIEAGDRLRLLLRQGYTAYSDGDYAAADSFYDQAMLLDPYNRDANLAVASVARQLGDFRRAENRYRHLLSLDGQDSAAFSGLLDVAAATGDQTIEHEMVVHIDNVEHPGRMHAALGNYYNAQRSWQLARDAWRDALTIDVSNPDYAFNLAVSLDHLQRHNSAIGYYQQALEHAATRTFHFDKTTTRDRLDSLIAARNN